MSNYIAPLLFVFISIGLISTYIYPGLQAVQVLQEQENLVNTAFKKSKDLTSKLEELLGLEAAFSAEDLGRLGVLLPVRLDTVRHIVEVDDIARRNHITIQSFGLPGSKGDKAQNESGVQVGAVHDLASAVLTVSCTGTYEDFRAFMGELETSLSLFDVTALSIDQASLSPEEIKQRAVAAESLQSYTGTVVPVALSYTIALQTYWLEPKDTP